MAQVIIYNTDDINTLIGLMDTELSIQGVQNAKTIANIHEILTTRGSIQEIPEQDEAPAPEKEESGNVEELFNADDEKNDVVEGGPKFAATEPNQDAEKVEGEVVE